MHVEDYVSVPFDERQCATSRLVAVLGQCRHHESGMEDHEQSSIVSTTGNCGLNGGEQFTGSDVVRWR